MIAVFSRYDRDFEELELTPKKLFVRIYGTNSIRGVRFTGVIKTYRWWENKEVEKAYLELKNRYPELFV